MAWEQIVRRKLNQQYVGPAETCDYSFSLWPEQIPGTGWLAQQFVDAHVKALLDDGAYLLELYVWEDTAPAWTTDYYVRVVSTASPLVWSIIIPAALALLTMIAITYTIHDITTTVRYIGDKAPITFPIMGIALVGAVVVAGIILLKRRAK